MHVAGFQFLKWMKWQKLMMYVTVSRDLHLLPAPLCRLPVTAPSNHRCQLDHLYGRPGWLIVRSRIHRNITMGCSWMSVLYLVSMRNCSVPASLLPPWSLWLVPSWPLQGHRAMWWNRVTWESWSGIREDILSWEQEVTPGRADSSGTRPRRSSQQWRSLLVKLRCSARANKGS